MTHDHMTDALLPPALVDEMTALVSQAGEAVMAARAGKLAVRQKADCSPVTIADEASHTLLTEGLARLLPKLPVVSEEAATQPAIEEPVFALVDPLDGTREFIDGRDEFTINLAIIRDGRPIFGIVSAPALQLVWRGTLGRGAERLHLAPGAHPSKAKERHPLRVSSAQGEALRVMVSRSHLDSRTRDWLARHPSVELMSCGSAVKFCRIAEGNADVYPRLAPTMEWDVAAGDAVLAAAGGAVRRPDGAPLVYGRGENEWRIPAFIAWNRAPA
jgi:3'(2'), 5'-bisphosphate nucleotidase